MRILCELAAACGLLVDMHCDESDDPHSRHVESLFAQAHRLSLPGRSAMDAAVGAGKICATSPPSNR